MQAATEQAIGWIWTRQGFNGARGAKKGADEPTLAVYNLAVELDGFIADQPYSIMIAETTTGHTIKRFDLRAAAGKLVFQVPPFERDCAFKIRKR